MPDDVPSQFCSRVCVVFELKTLTDEGARTVGVSKIASRPVRIVRVLNGRCSADEDECLEAEFEPLPVDEDEDDDKATVAAAAEALSALTEVIGLQRDLAGVDAGTGGVRVCRARGAPARRASDARALRGERVGGEAGRRRAAVGAGLRVAARRRVADRPRPLAD